MPISTVICTMHDSQQQIFNRKPMLG